MRVLKGWVPVAVSVGLIMAVTAILWKLRLAANGHLIYIYLFPVTLIAALYNGRLAVLSAVIALLCGDFFLEARMYSFVDDNPLEYGDLFCFALLAILAIKFIRELAPRASPSRPHIARHAAPLTGVRGVPAKLSKFQYVDRQLDD